MSMNYRKPPIVEAICEFQFSQDSEWDATMPGLIYERVRGTFSEIRPTKRFNIEVAASVSGQVNQRVLTSEHSHFWRKDEKAFMQVGPRLLAINVLKPYPGWAKFLPLISNAFDKYTEVARPRGLHGIALRYINHLDFRESIVELSDYFDFYPHVGDRLPENYSAFLVGADFLSADLANVLKIEMGDGTPTDNVGTRFVLDINYRLVEPQSVALDDVLTWVESAHEKISEAFEASIKDNLKKTFGYTKDKEIRKKAAQGAKP